MAQQENTMKLWIDDDYKDILLVAIFKEEKKIAEKLLEENDYLLEEDRLWDEEWLRGLNIMLKNYDIATDA